jgi:hypothetical protein
MTGLMVAIAAWVWALLLPVTAQGSDPPHWSSTTQTIDCANPCHVGHQSLGMALSKYTNLNLCQSCHNTAGLADQLPIDTEHLAIPHVSGTSHAVGKPAVNAQYGAQLPLDGEMQIRIDGAGNILCSTCHDQHAASSAFGGTPRVSSPDQTTALGSTGTIDADGVFNGSQGLWYLVEIVQGGSESNARFCYSKDSGISWFPAGCNPPGTTTPNLTANGATPVALDSGVEVTFSTGSYVAQERWELSASWPFLRAQLDTAAEGSIMCRDCHRSWDMTHAAVESYDGTYKSHPVGVGLDANTQGYDRIPPLDGNGGAAGSDGIASNDLVLDGSNNVQCLTCHGIHYVDSNTQTEDGP